MKKIISMITIICFVFVSMVAFAQSSDTSHDMKIYDVGTYACTGKVQNHNVKGDQNYYVNTFRLIEERDHFKQNELPKTIGVKLMVDGVKEINVFWALVRRVDGKPVTVLLKKYPQKITDKDRTFIAMKLNNVFDYDYYAIMLVITNGDNIKDRTYAAWHIRK